MEIKRATSSRSLSLCGIIVIISLFMGHDCLGMTENFGVGTVSNNKCQKTNSTNSPRLFNFFLKPFSTVNTYIQNNWASRTTALVAAYAFGTVCSIARRYRVPLLAGSAAGALTYAGCSYLGIRQRGFFAGAAFAGVSATVAWFCYQIEVKKDLQEIKNGVKAIQAKLETLANETADKVVKELMPRLEPLFKELLNKLETVPEAVKNLLKQELGAIQNLIDKTHQENTIEHSETQNEINKLNGIIKGLEKQLTDLLELVKKIPVQIK